MQKKIPVYIAVVATDRDLFFSFVFTTTGLFFVSICTQVRLFVTGLLFEHGWKLPGRFDPFADILFFGNSSRDTVRSVQLSQGLV